MVKWRLEGVICRVTSPALIPSPMRPAFLLLLWGLLASRPARAQDGLAIAPTTTAVMPAAPTDTAAALHRLFARQRTHGHRLVPITLGIGAALTAVGAFDNPPGNDPLEVGLARLFAVVAGVVTTTIVTSELIHYGRYSRLNEQRALAQFRAHQLPASLQEQLNPKYFQPEAKRRRNRKAPLANTLR